MNARTTYNAGTAAMAERVRRATGRAVTRENTGGNAMVAVTTAPNETVVVFHPEGYAVYADMAAWDGGADPIHQDSTTPLETVLAVTSLVYQRCEVCGDVALDMMRDVNAGGLWVALCTGHADAVTEHADDCDCDTCTDEHTTYVLTDGEVSRQSVHTGEDAALDAHAALVGDYAGDYRDGGTEVTVVTANVRTGAVVASTTRWS